jgi:hypothetical protein
MTHEPSPLQNPASDTSYPGNAAAQSRPVPAVPMHAQASQQPMMYQQQPPAYQNAYSPYPGQPAAYPGNMPAAQPVHQPHDLVSHYGLTTVPPQPPVIGAAPTQPSFVVGSSMNNGTHTLAPSVGPVQTVDPTIAIALSLSQSIPTLMKAPPAGSKPEVVNAWRSYLRRIQDAQNRHTREIRDAQVQHDRDIREAEIDAKKHNMSMMGSSYNMMSSISSLMHAGSNQYNYQKDYKNRLDNAKLHYDQAVEHAHQRLNDEVEWANRDYEDTLLSLAE